MECDLFHTTAIINGFHQLRTLIDPGSSAFATISQEHVNKLRLKTQPLKPRLITGVLNTISGLITQVTSFQLDIGGLLITQVWAYVVPNQAEDLILGMPWLKHCNAELDSAQSKLLFKNHNISIISNEERISQAITEEKSIITVNQVMASTFAGLVQRAKRDPELKIFAASMTDIEKALRPKVQLSIEEITQMLPDCYKKFASVLKLGFK